MPVRLLVPGALPYAPTRKLNDARFEGAWSVAPRSTIVFADHNMDGSVVAHHGGLVAGGSGDVPVHLVFWGGEWGGTHALERRLVEERVDAVFGSGYFRGLLQYGIAANPVRRSSVVLTDERPPRPDLTDADEILEACLEQVRRLVESATIPALHGRTQPIHMVLLPPTQVAAAVLGSHRRSTGLARALDDPWVAWLRWTDLGSYPELTLCNLCHQLVDLMTNPEGDGWHTDRNTLTNEICDSGGSPAEGETARTDDFTWHGVISHGARLPSYWSNSHQAQIIPLDRPIQARLRTGVMVQKRRLRDEGTFRPAGAAIGVEDRAYRWRVDLLEQVMPVRLETEGLHQPAASGWTVNGVPVDGVGSLTLDLDLCVPQGSGLVERAGQAQVLYSASGTGLDLAVAEVDGCFDLLVQCAVRDRSISGRARVEPVATPSLVIGVRGADLELDPDYLAQVERGARDLVGRSGSLTAGPREEPGLLRAAMGGFVPNAEWERARLVAFAISAAFAQLAPAAAMRCAAALLDALPSVDTAAALHKLRSWIDDPDPVG